MADGGRRCDYCGAVIAIGHGVVVDGRVYHELCVEKVKKELP